MSSHWLSRAARAMCAAALATGVVAQPAASETKTNYAYDPLGRLISVSDGVGGAVTYRYDAAGNRTQVIVDVAAGEILPTSWSSSSTAGTSGLTTVNGMRDRNYASVTSVHLTNVESNPWVRAHFATPVVISTACIAPATYGAVGAGNINGATIEYSTDGGGTWQPLGSVSGTAAGVCGSIPIGVTANSIRASKSVGPTSPPVQLAIGDFRFYSASGGASVPGVTDKTLSVPFNTPASIDLTPTGSWTSVVPVTLPTKGTVAIADALATYSPTPGSTGSDVFTYKALGATGESAVASVLVMIGAPTSPPTVTPKTLIVPQGGSNSIDVTPSGNWTGVQLATNFATGDLQPHIGHAAINQTTATYTTPDATYWGNTYFNYTATGPGGTSAPARIDVRVIPPPPIVSNKSVTYLYNSGGPILLTPSGAWTEIIMTRPPGKGTAYESDPYIVYTSAQNQSYTTTFDYMAKGPGGDSNTATVTITVNGPPPPTAQPKNLMAAAGVSSQIPLSAVFTSGDTSPTFALASPGPSKGTVSLSGSTATYTPSVGQSGGDEFWYTAAGLGGTGPAAKVSINITAAPLSIGINSTDYSRNRNGTAYVGAGSPGPITVTPNGGSGTYTYQWIRAANPGDTTITVNGGNSATATWSSSRPTSQPGTYVAYWFCRVSDGVNTPVDSPTVTVTLTLFGGIDG